MDRSNQLGNHLASFLLLSVVTLGDHLIENIARTLGVAHVDIGTCQIELGRGLVGTCLLYTSRCV